MSDNPVTILIGKSNNLSGGPPGSGQPGAPKKGPAPKAPPPPVKVQVRTATLNLKAEWNANDTFDPTTAVTVSAGAFETALVEPSQPKFAKAGDAITVKIKVTGKGVYEDCEAVGTVKVLKLPTSIAWQRPQPVLINTVLGPAQQNAAITPPLLANRM